MVDAEGVWRTIGGRRVFIRDGQDLASAMKESGKFPSKAKKENKPIGFDEHAIYDALQKEVEKNDNLTFFGLRVDEKDYRSGAHLPLSEDMSADSETYGKKLNGTSAIYLDISKFSDAEEIKEEISRAKSHMDETYHGKHYSIVAGYDQEYGNDQYEVILQTTEFNSRRRGAKIIARLS